MEKYPKGSMGEADQKSENIMKIVGTILIMIIFSLSYLNLGHTYFHDYMVRASTGAQVLGAVLYFASAAWLWIGTKLFPVVSSKVGPEVLSVILLGLAIATSAGFNFDLHGIEAGA